MAKTPTDPAFGDVTIHVTGNVADVRGQVRLLYEVARQMQPAHPAMQSVYAVVHALMVTAAAVMWSNSSKENRSYIQSFGAELWREAVLIRGKLFSRKSPANDTDQPW